jgi:transposase
MDSKIERWRNIRTLAQQGVSQREIARVLGINRRTVARMLAAQEPPRYKRKPAGSQLDALADAMELALERWPDIKAPQMTELLRAGHGYRGSVDLVRRRLALLRKRDTQPTPSTQELPGSLLRFEWAEMPGRPHIEGARRRVYALIASLPFSTAQTAYFSFEATLGSFLEGHVRVFEWLGGVPVECVYGELSATVAKRDRHMRVHWNKRFVQLRDHYAFRATASHPDGPHVDSSLEHVVSDLKDSFWQAHKFDDFKKIDALYRAWRDSRRQRVQNDAPHPDAAASNPLVATARLHGERTALRPLPETHFDYSAQRTVKVPPDGYVRYGASYYRAPMELVGKPVALHVSREHVWIVWHGRRVADYRRCYEAGVRVHA